jgi:hypothetical protein
MISGYLREIEKPKPFYNAGSSARIRGTWFASAKERGKVDVEQKPPDQRYSVAVRRIQRNDMFITRLDLSSLALGPGGAVRLFEVLAKNTHLKQLNLENNNLSVEDARALARTLIVNRSCCEINLAGNNMSEGLKDLHDAMQENTSVKLTF